MVTTALLADGVSEPTLRLGLRATAVASFAWFACAYVAPAVSARGELPHLFFAGFAGSHAVHLALIVALGLSAEENPFGIPALIGAVGFVFLVPAFVLSFSVSWAAKPGFRIFRRLAHHVVWTVFTLFFIGIAARGELHAGALGAVALALLGLRVFRRERVVASDR